MPCFALLCLTSLCHGSQQCPFHFAKVSSHVHRTNFPPSFFFLSFFPSKISSSPSTSPPPTTSLEMDSPTSNLGHDPRHSVLPPQLIQQQQQPSHNRETSENLKDNYKVLDKRFKDHLQQEDEEMKKFEERRTKEKNELIEEFDRNTPKLRTELLKKLEGEREATRMELEIALKKLRSSITTDPPVSIAAANGPPINFPSVNKRAPPPPPKPATLTGLALHAASSEYTTTRQSANASATPVVCPRDYSAGLLESNRPSAAAAPLSPLSSVIATEPQSGIKEVRNQTMNKVGDYVYSMEERIGAGVSARVYRCLSSINGKKYVSIFRLDVCC